MNTNTPDPLQAKYNELTEAAASARAKVISALTKQWSALPVEKRLAAHQTLSVFVSAQNDPNSEAHKDDPVDKMVTRFAALGMATIMATEAANRNAEPPDLVTATEAALVRELGRRGRATVVAIGDRSEEGCRIYANGNKLVVAGLAAMVQATLGGSKIVARVEGGQLPPRGEELNPPGDDGSEDDE